MNLLGLIKDKLTDSVIEKVSNFLGESPENISLALDKAFPTVLGGIIQQASTEENAGKVMDVLKDGGHTGEILEDLPVLLSHFDKAQLLITIGTNIFNHFLGSKSNSIYETISSLSNIRKTSASSLVGLATPLVLGALGKVVAKEGMGVSGLMRFLNEQRDSVIAALPPVIMNKLVMKEDMAPKKVLKEPTKEKKQERSARPKNAESGGASSWIPWVFLVLVLAAIVVYMFKYKADAGASSHAEINPQIDSSAIALADTSSAMLLPDSSRITAPIAAEKAQQIAAEPKIEERKTEPAKAETKPASVPASTVLPSTGVGSLVDELKNSKSWIALPNLNFRKGSAEISGNGDVNELVRFLKSSTKTKVTIAGGGQSGGSTLGEDRAYALRELLLEKGVSQSQIDVQSRTVKDIDAKIVVKVIK